MKSIALFLAACVIIAFSSCNKKSHPSGKASVNRLDNNDGGKTGSEDKKTVTIKPATPTVIVVNDSIAKKTPDGRYYYDLKGKRYWKNNKDGKYYLFNKSMYNNPDFKGIKP